MSIISIPFTFTVGAVIIASQHNSNFSTIYSDYNGNITTANLSASAAVADTQLAQITTAGKVSGAALTSLSSTPSGAGVVPTANLGTGTANSTVMLSGAQTYVNPGTIITGQLGSWASSSSTSVIQATTDLFITVQNATAGTTFTVTTDSANPPTVTRARGYNSGATLGSCSCFVKKNEYYQVAISGGTAIVYTIPLGV